MKLEHDRREFDRVNVALVGFGESQVRSSGVMQNAPSQQDSRPTGQGHQLSLTITRTFDNLARQPSKTAFIHDPLAPSHDKKPYPMSLKLIQVSK